MDIATAKSALEMIRDDCITDASALDGQPLTGLTMGTMFGNVLAMIDTLALIVEQLLPDQP